ncbi:hypothetical protein [Phaffia rhodozyma]|uniref:Arrestin C-terminal-like domain-containing protein n=1 Tax=Phaffia rhodozyma TaxID=264483 RepID=A0A0F7SSP6_PHARH|nr:hypothetical protein [Phaffia rhodozyma]
MSKPISIDIRSPANRGFVQGYPGIPVSSRTEPRRPPCTVSGTVEVQGGKGLKAVSLKISLVKRETLPSDVGVTSFCEDVSPAITLWSCPPSEDHGILDSVKVFPFSIGLPPFLPPTVDLVPQPRTRAPNGRPMSFDVSQGNGRPPGIGYYLEVTLLERSKKKGLLRKETQGTEKVVQPIEIWPHDLHSDWPIYNVPKTVSAQGSQVYMALTLPQTSFSPSSTLSLPFVLHPLHTQTQPIALKHITLTLLETVTFRTPLTGSFPSSGSSKPEAMSGMLSGKKSLSRPTSSPQVTVVAQSRMEIPDDFLFPEDKNGKVWNLMLKLPPSASADADASLPGGGGSSSRGQIGSNGIRWTVRNGRHVEVKFYIGIEVWGIKGYQTQLLGSIKDVEVVMDWEEAGEAKQRIAEIGYVESLCGRNRNLPTTASASTSTLIPPSRSFEPPVLVSPTPPSADGFFPPGLASQPISLSPRSSPVKTPSQIPYSTGSPQPTPVLSRQSLSQSGKNQMSAIVNSVGSPWEAAAVKRNSTEQGTITGLTAVSRDGLLESNNSSSSSSTNQRVSLMNGSSRAVSGPLAADRMRDQSQGTRRSASMSIGRPPDFSSSSSLPVNSPLSSPSISATTKTVTTLGTDLDRTGSPGPRPPMFNEEDGIQPTYQTAEQEKALLFQRAQLAASSSSANPASSSTLVSAIPPFSPQLPPPSPGPSSSQPQPRVRGQSGLISGRQNSPQIFESAEQEKRRLFLEAQRRVTKTHASAAVAHPSATAPNGHSSRETGSISNVSGSEPGPSRQKWETAEQEKARLFQEARNRVAATQAGGENDLVIASSSSPSSFPLQVPLSPISTPGGRVQVVPHRFSSILPIVSHVPLNESHRLSSYVGSTSQPGSIPDNMSSIKAGMESVGREPAGLTDASEEGRGRDELMSYESLFGKQNENEAEGSGEGGSKSRNTGDRMSTSKVTSEKDRLKLFHAAQEAVAIRHPAGHISTPVHTPAPLATTNKATPVAQKTIPPVLPVRPPAEYAAKYIDPALMGTVGK